MVYVALSRVESLSQLYILEALPVNKIKPWTDAVEEMNRLDELDKQGQRKNEENFIILSLNICSLASSIDDILSDPNIHAVQVLCLQETWLKPEIDNNLNLPNFQYCHYNSVRKGAGIATYFNEPFKLHKDISAVSYQMTVICSEEVSIINIYRSSSANNSNLICHLKTELENQCHPTVIICADWNFCHRDEKNHCIYKFLIANEFSPCGNPPKASQKEGRCIDMIWMRSIKFCDTFTYGSKAVYYSDHDQQLLCLNEKK